MMLILRWILFALAILFVGWLVPGISVENFSSALLITFVMALINIFIRPLAMFITLPINILTLGLFGFVLNALLFMLAGNFVSGVAIDGFWSAFLGSLVLALLGIGIDSVTNKK